ncbi:hypothetical protein C1H46_029287 [Malus baccata]|uniref:Uncharacterized protein n=1 Tax=Malus baccata TaxID=106549 RepID=A0A540LFT7_MALBA|nr:hypothetical protein C1H46_029287 [Malus baccata]
MFHFSAESLAKLRAKANAESGTTKISSFQSLSALLWRSITRARCQPPDQGTSCRHGELLEHGLGWAAWKLHEAVVNHNDKGIGYRAISNGLEVQKETMDGEIKSFFYSVESLRDL